jgi:hypothetical protein
MSRPATGEHKRMKRNTIVLFILVLTLMWASQAWPHIQAGQPSAAQTSQRAGLIVQFGDLSYVTRCVSFSGDSVSGLDLLRQSGLNIATWGAAVCRIEGEGCEYPTERCFCQCLATPCRYWSYWYWSDGRWIYSPLGAADRRSRQGDMDGWIWGDGQSPPPAVSFEQICNPAEPPAVGDTSVPSPIPSDASELAGQPLLNASGIPSAMATPTLTRSQDVPVAQYAAFALVAAVLLGGFWLQSSRRKQ